MTFSFYSPPTLTREQANSWQAALTNALDTYGKLTQAKYMKPQMEAELFNKQYAPISALLTSPLIQYMDPELRTQIAGLASQHITPLLAQSSINPSFNSDKKGFNLPPSSKVSGESQDILANKDIASKAVEDLRNTYKKEMPSFQESLKSENPLLNLISSGIKKGASWWSGRNAPGAPIAEAAIPSEVQRSHKALVDALTKVNISKDNAEQMVNTAVSQFGGDIDSAADYIQNEIDKRVEQANQNLGTGIGINPNKSSRGEAPTQNDEYYQSQADKIHDKIMQEHNKDIPLSIIYNYITNHKKLSYSGLLQAAGMKHE